MVGPRAFGFQPTNARRWSWIRDAPSVCRWSSTAARAWRTWSTALWRVTGVGDIADDFGVPEEEVEDVIRVATRAAAV